MRGLNGHATTSAALKSNGHWSTAQGSMTSSAPQESPDITADKRHRYTVHLGVRLSLHKGCAREADAKLELSNAERVERRCAQLHLFYTPLNLDFTTLRLLLVRMKSFCVSYTGGRCVRRSA